MAKHGKRVALYLRVSKEDQTTENQRLELERIAAARGWEIVGTYCDHAISGAKFGKDRPELERLRKDASRRKFDIVMAWHIDRVGRSTAQVASFMAEMEGLGVGQFYHQQGMDASTVYGKGMIQMALVFAEIERGLIQERVKAGLARAKAMGTKSGKAIGRPRVDAAIEDRVRALRREGRGILKIASELGVGSSTVQRIVAR